MATIRLNRNKWQAIVRRAGYPQQSKTFLSKTDARKWARQTEAKLDMGIVSGSNSSAIDIRVDELLIRYRATVTSKKKGRASEEIRIGAFLKQPWAKRKVSSLTPSVLSAFRDQRLKQVQPATVRRDMGLLRAILEYGIREWNIRLTENPLAKLQKPKEGPPRQRRLEGDELKLILEASEHQRESWLKNGVILAVETGMRRGEL